jgi:hypothetical protein
MRDKVFDQTSCPVDDDGEYLCCWFFFVVVFDDNYYNNKSSMIFLCFMNNLNKQKLKSTICPWQLKNIIQIICIINYLFF